MTKKYLLIGDYVSSKNDGDRHFIDAKTLCRLYNLNPEDCVFTHYSQYDYYKNLKGLIWLEPKKDGNYEA